MPGMRARPRHATYVPQAGNVAQAPPAAAGRPRVLDRVLVLARRLGVGGGPATAVAELDPAAAEAALGAADLGAVDLGAGRTSGAHRRGRDRQDALAAARLGQRLVVGQQVEGGEAGGDEHRRELLVAVGRGVEAVRPEQQRRCGVELRAEDVAERDRPAAVLDDGDGLRGRQPARPLARDLLERLRDRPDGAEVGAGADQRRPRPARAGVVRPRRGGAPTRTAARCG